MMMMFACSVRGCSLVQGISVCLVCDWCVNSVYVSRLVLSRPSAVCYVFVSIVMSLLWGSVCLVYDWCACCVLFHRSCVVVCF